MNKEEIKNTKSIKMPRPVPTIKGNLVTLRPIHPETDARDYYEYNLEPDMHIWTGNWVLKSIDEAKQELKRYVEMRDMSFWMIVDNKSNRVIGRFFTSLEKRDGKLVGGSSTRIGKPFWRKGHNREARELMVRYIFNELNADEIETGILEGNVNSIKSVESFGFQFSHKKPSWNEKYQKNLYMLYYVMTKDFWIKHKKRIPRMEN